MAVCVGGLLNPIKRAPQLPHPRVNGSHGDRKPEFDSRIGHHVKKSKRGARQQKAATVLPNRTDAT